MLPFQWLTTLKDHLLSRKFSNTRTRRNQYRRFQATFAQTSTSRSTTETLEDRTMLTSVFSIDDVTVEEGDSGTTNAVFTVTRSGNSVGDLNSIASVDFTTQDGTATSANDDFIALASSLNFAADSSAIEQTQTITIQVNGDELTEGNEAFQILLSNNSGDTTIQNSIGTATINNDDLNSLRINDVTASENEEFVFEISLDEIAGSDITFLVNTLEDTAENNDYTFHTNKRVTIRAGELTTQVRVHVHDDEVREADEVFSLVLSDPRIDGEPLPSTVTIADDTGQGTILNDDGLPGSVFTITGEKIAEGNDYTQLLKFTIIRTGGTTGDLNFATSVNFNTVNGTAVAGEDYTRKSEVVHFSANAFATSQTFVVYVEVQGDLFRELSETVIGRLSNPTGGSLLKGNVSSLDAIGIITNDDSEFVFQDSFSADPIHANHTGDLVGRSVAIDGDVMVVGASSSKLRGNDTGIAYVYARNQQGTLLDQSDDTWDYQAFLQSPVPQEMSYFASSVAVDEDTIVVGPSRSSTSDVYVFYVFTRVGDDWKSKPPHVEQIRVNGLYQYSQHGSSVEIYEDTIILGAYNDTSIGTRSGAAYIFEKEGNNWANPSVRQLLPTSPGFEDFFGWSVAIHSNLIVVGAHGDDDNGTNSGAAYIYTKVGESWITNSPLVKKLTASNSESGDHFGISVATNGTDIVVGASGRSSNGNQSGSVYLYNRTGTDWVSIQPNELEFIGSNEGTFFGSKVAISENQMVVGTHSTGQVGVFYGAVYVYVKSGPDWNVDTAIESMLTHYEWDVIGYGNAVAVSNNTVLIGTLWVDLDGEDSGGAYVYEIDENDSWLLTSEINPNEPVTAHNGDDNFGQSIAVSEDYLLISAPGTDSTLAPTGIVYLYAKNDAGTPNFYDDDTWDYETSLVDPAPEARREFGASVAIDGTTIIVTAETPSYLYGNTEVYVYTRNGSDWVTIPPTVTPLLANAARQLPYEISVALQNGTIVVGNASGSSNVAQSGVVYVYEKSGTDWYTIAPTETKLSASDGAINDHFGISVDIDGDQIIVGADEHENRGAAYLYQKGITGWNSATEIKLMGSDIQANDEFGKLVAIEDNTVVITSRSAGSNYSGAVYIIDGTNGWRKPVETRISPLTDRSKYNFGTSIDLQGNLLVVTGSLPPNPFLSGSVYIYDGSEGWSNHEETIIKYATDSELYHRGFGHSAAAIHQNSLLVAALYKDFTTNSLVYSYTRTSSSDIHLRVVDSPTNTQPNGEASTLPVHQDNVSEWSSYWVEIWVNANSPTNAGIFSTGLDLDYNTEFTSATEIEFGTGFSQNQSGTINDAGGAIDGLYAETTASNLGTEKYLLFARIKFESLAEDQVLLDYEGKSVGPHDLGFRISAQQVSLVGDGPVTTNLGQFYGASIYANPYDLNDDDLINFRDLIIFASAYSSIPSESNLVYSWFADYNQNDQVDYRDLILFATNYGKSKALQSTVYHHPNFPDAWNQFLTLESPLQPSLDANPVTQSTADSVWHSVVEEVAPQLTVSQNDRLEKIDVQVVDLEGDILGRAVAGTIYIDVNAAGQGWFVDSTPEDHSEFTFSSELTLIALPDSEAADGIDLWTVILHELGHLLGHEHEAEGLMQETLAPGVRYLPAWDDDVDSFFIELTDDTNLIDF